MGFGLRRRSQHWFVEVLSLFWSYSWLICAWDFSCLRMAQNWQMKGMIGARFKHTH